MSVQSVLSDITNSTAKVNAEKSKSRMGTSAMDQDAFLQLMMAQMKNQDPMNPTDNTQMLQQQASFTQISELQKMNKTLGTSNQFVQASSLIGKQVSITDPDNSLNTIEGVVSEARMNGTGTNILVNNVEYPVASVTSIKQ